jgi:glycopeptide antibiotics resistance protein
MKDNIFAFLNKKMTTVSNVLTTFLLILLATLAAWLYKEIMDWLNLMGAFAGVALAFTIPGKELINE